MLSSQSLPRGRLQITPDLAVPRYAPAALKPPGAPSMVVARMRGTKRRR